jgi:hypothetical protein
MNSKRPIWLFQKSSEDFVPCSRLNLRKVLLLKREKQIRNNPHHIINRQCIHGTKTEEILYKKAPLLSFLNTLPPLYFFLFVSYLPSLFVIILLFYHLPFCIFCSLLCFFFFFNLCFFPHFFHHHHHSNTLIPSSFTPFKRFLFVFLFLFFF